jgi:hypothetical protein
VSVSKVLAADTTGVIKALTDPRRRRQWVGAADPQLATALSSAISDKASKGFVVRPDGLARFRYKWDGTTVQFYLEPKAGGNVSLVVQHTKLANAAAVDERRAQWKASVCRTCRVSRAVMASRQGWRLPAVTPVIESPVHWWRAGRFAQGSTAVTLRFGTCPTGMRVSSFLSAMSTTDTEFDPAFATYTLLLSGVNVSQSG